MFERADEAALLSDAYIDELLNARVTSPAAAIGADLAPERDIRRAADILAGGLPRLHPSFLFEERLAHRLLEGWPVRGEGELVVLPTALRVHARTRLDRRMVLGGVAVASSVSVAAVYAWRHAGRRSRHRARPGVSA